MMDKNTIEEIAEELQKIFGEDTVIYAENQPNGFQEPSFYVRNTSTTAKYELANYQFITENFQVIYFASEDDANSQLSEVSRRLLAGFSYVGKDLALGKTCTADSTEKTLNFEFYLQRRYATIDENDTGEPMKGIKYNGRTK